MQKWYDWLGEMKKEDEVRKMEDVHQRKVSQMIECADFEERGRGCQGRMIGAKKRGKNGKALANLRSCAISREQALEHEDLRKLEEDFPTFRDCDLENASRLYKAKTGVGCDGFQPKVSVDWTKETQVEVVEFLEKVEESG